MKDVAGPLPCENFTGCTLTQGGRAGQNIQPWHDLGGVLQGSQSFVYPRGC